MADAQTSPVPTAPVAAAPPAPTAPPVADAPSQTEEPDSGARPASPQPPRNPTSSPAAPAPASAPSPHPAPTLTPTPTPTPTPIPTPSLPAPAAEQSSLTTSATATADPGPAASLAPAPAVAAVAHEPPARDKPLTPDPSAERGSAAANATASTVSATSMPAASRSAPDTSSPHPNPLNHPNHSSPSTNSSPSAVTKPDSETTATTITIPTAPPPAHPRKPELDTAPSQHDSPAKTHKQHVPNNTPALPSSSASSHLANPRTSSPPLSSSAAPPSAQPPPAAVPSPAAAPPARNRRRHSSPPKPPASDSPALNERPIPRNLPKTVKRRPENSRVFIGNLASEYTDVVQIIHIFHKYGDLIEEPVLRRSFGFVQYSSADAASRAVAGEQGRIIGGIAIDLSIADNREVKRGTHVANNTPYGQPTPSGKSHPRGRVREREFASDDRNDKSRKRRRSLSPASAAKKGGVHPPQYRRTRPDPRNGIYLRILCMSPTAKLYARHCENTFRSMTGLAADVLNIVAAGLGEALGRAMRDVIPYVMVVASKDVEDGTCTIRTLEKTGYEKSGRGNGVIPLQEAVEVCLIERGVIAPQSIAQQMNSGPHGGMGRPGGRHGQHGMGSHGRQWNSHNSAHPGNAAVEAAKPGWMTGPPRAPHPSNPRAAPTSMGAGMHHQAQHGNVGSVVMSGGFGYNGMDGSRGPYGGHGPGSSPGQGPPHRGNQAYGRIPPQSQGGYEPGPPINQGANMVAPGHQNVGGDYMRRGGGAPVNPALGMHPPGGYMDRYSAQMNNQNANGYSGRGDNRESEYDPAAVMPGQRGPNANYGSGWNRDMGGMNRETYGGERGGPPHQPAVARDRNGGFQTIGGGTQVYPGGSGSAAANNYGYDRSQNQGGPGGAYGAVNNTSGYDMRANAYGGAQTQGPVGYGQYGGPQGPSGMPPQGADGVNRYGGNMYGEGPPQQQQQQQQAAQQQAYAVPGMYSGGGPGVGGRGGGWSGTNSSHGNAMNMPNPPMGGNMNQNAMGLGGMGAQMGMQGNASAGMSGAGGGQAGMNGYGVGPHARGNLNGGYVGRESGGGGSNGGPADGNGSVGAPAAASVLGQSAVDIKKLTNLISVFQQKQAASQAQGHDGDRGMQGYAGAQYQGQAGHQRSGAQQGYYR